MKKLKNISQIPLAMASLIVIFGVISMSNALSASEKNLTLNSIEIGCHLKNGEYKFEFETPYNFFNDEVNIFNDVLTYHKSDHLTQINIDWISKRKFNLKHRFVRKDSISGNLISEVKTDTFEIIACNKDTIYFLANFQNTKSIKSVLGWFVRLH